MGRIVFLVGAVWKEGVRHGPLPFFEYKLCEFSYCRLILMKGISLYMQATLVDWRESLTSLKELPASPWLVLWLLFQL